MGKLARINAKKREERMEQQQKLTEEQKEEQQKLTGQTEELIGRFTCFSGWHLINKEIGLGLDTMIVELYVQIAFNHAAIIAMTGIMAEHGIQPISVTKRVNAFLEHRLSQMEQQYHIRVTPKECYSVDENGKKIEDKGTVQ